MLPHTGHSNSVGRPAPAAAEGVFGGLGTKSATLCPKLADAVPQEFENAGAAGVVGAYAPV